MLPDPSQSIQINLQDAAEKDFPRIVELNRGAVQATSPMDSKRLDFLHGIACYHRVAVVKDSIAAFLLAMDAAAAYENPNFNWFISRYDSFVYIDRIVVAGQYRGLQIGSRLYRDLFRFARHNGYRRVGCEYNIQPPNPASRAFHTAFGFREAGRQQVAGGTKLVSLQVRELFDKTIS